MADGTPSQRLSPEEERAVAIALGRPVPPPRESEIAEPAGDGQPAGEIEERPPGGAA
jgi:hypothetical protein